MKDGDKLVEAVKKRNQQKLLWMLLSSPIYEYKLECLIPYKIDGSEETLCWN
jgi:hypothetical protein